MPRNHHHDNPPNASELADSILKLAPHPSATEDDLKIGFTSLEVLPVAIPATDITLADCREINMSVKMVAQLSAIKWPDENNRGGGKGSG